MEPNIHGHVILLMAPMASGKGMLVRHLQEQFPELKFLVSCTTREPRPGEAHGVHYYFLTRAEFEAKIENGDFLEWAEFSGNLYGTLKSEIMTPLAEGKVVLNEIELQGIQILERIIPKDARTIIYVEAGGWDVLLERMRARAPMSDEHVQMRYERYLEERKVKPFADVVIENYNGQFEAAKEQVNKVVQNIFDKVRNTHGT